MFHSDIMTPPSFYFPRSELALRRSEMRAGASVCCDLNTKSFKIYILQYMSVVSSEKRAERRNE